MSDTERLHTLHSVLSRVKDGEDGREDPELAHKLDAAFGKYVAWLTGRCASELRHFGPQEVEEAVAETLCIAWRRLPEYRGEGRFRTWLGGIAVHVCRGVRRKSREVLTEDGLVEPASPEASVLAGLLREERENLVRAAAEAVLDAQEQEVVELWYVHEYPHDQIAEMMGFDDKDKVRVTLKRCKYQLKNELIRRLAAMGHGQSLVS
jgi:RNA polymerase sigma factor (sigma-70 family)